LVEICTKSIESGGIELVEATVADGLVEYEVGLFKDTQMLGDGGPGDGKFAGELTDGEGALREAGEDGTAGGIAESIELEVLVSTH
jgi:hypothetical protein